jgi:hypothetical protein
MTKYKFQPYDWSSAAQNKQTVKGKLDLYLAGYNIKGKTNMNNINEAKVHRFIYFLADDRSTYQYSIRLANSPHIDFMILSASDQDPGGLLPNLEAVDIGCVSNKLLCKCTSQGL